MADYLSREEILQAFGCLAVKNPDDKYQHGMQDAIDCLIPEVINEMRAADVQPVKHGRWENPVSVGNGIMFCSVCRNEAYRDTDYGQQLFDYCPYCGARMDGDTKNE